MKSLSGVTTTLSYTGEDVDLMPEHDDEDAQDVFTGGTDWGEAALQALTEVLRRPEFHDKLQMFAFKVSKERRKIGISIDKLEDKFGSPTLDEITLVSRLLNVTLEGRGFPDDVSFEVASPGAERRVRIPSDLDRFRHLKFKVMYTASAEEVGTEGNVTRVLMIENIEGEDSKFVTWKLANVRSNYDPAGKKGVGMTKKQKEWRLRMSIDDIVRANLYIDL